VQVHRELNSIQSSGLFLATLVLPRAILFPSAPCSLFSSMLKHHEFTLLSPQSLHHRTRKASSSASACKSRHKQNTTSLKSKAINKRYAESSSYCTVIQVSTTILHTFITPDPSINSPSSQTQQSNQQIIQHVCTKNCNQL
jgi:hypothetical protein